MGGLTYPTFLNPVFILQKKAVKAMTFSDITTPSLPFNKLELLRLTDISNLQLASFVFECVNGLSPQFFENYFTSSASKHGKGARQSTRGNLLLERQHTIQYGKRSVQYSGAKLWNSIPSEITLQIPQNLKDLFLILRLFFSKQENFSHFLRKIILIRKY